MTIVQPAPGEPRRPDGPRDPGDAWVVAPNGEKYWGQFGAAGLLAVDAERGILMQHRVSWSHFGGTWGLPGGAMNQGETALDGAQREAREEAGVPIGAVRPRFASVLDLGIWSYTTVVADVVVPFEPVISDPESVALEWVPIDQVADRPLHPGFADAWEDLRALLGVRPALLVDAANVVGAVPDGWWQDRAGAAARFCAELAGVVVPADDLGLAAHTGVAWYPAVVLVVEGQERTLESATDNVDAVAVVHAPGSGADAILAETERRARLGQAVTVVTSDRELTSLVQAAGASVLSSGSLRHILDTTAR